jgi:peptide/nickel transport system substrate-binding protein
MGELKGRHGADVVRRATAMGLVLCLAALTACGRIPSEDATSDAGLVVDTYANVNTSDDPPTLGGVLRYGLPFETNSWNPGLGQWEGHSMQVARGFFDPLFEYDEGGNVHPFLLERADHNADYTTWTLVVRDGVRFHNGRKLTAADIARVQVSYMNSPVVGSAWAINQLSGAQIVDDRTLVVHSVKPWVTLPHQSASQLGFVPDPDWLESGDWGHPVGTGPFMVDRWFVGDRLILKKNPNYWRSDHWGNRLPYLDSVEYAVVPDDSNRYAMLRRGALDVMMQTAPGPVAGQLIKAAKADEIQLITENRGETPEDFVLLNTLGPTLADVDARRALAAAVDRDEASRVLSNGVSPPADGMFEPSSPWYVPSDYPAHDPDRARALLAQVQARRGSPLTFVLKGPDTPEGLVAMQFVQAEWAKVGVQVRVEGVKLSNMLITMMMGDYDALLYQRFDYPDPAPELVLVNPAQARPRGEFTLNFARVRDDGVTQAIDGALHSISLQGRKDAMALLQQRISDLVPYVWLMHGRRHIAARPGVVNVVHHSLPDGAPGLDFLQGSHRIDQIWLRPGSAPAANAS